MFNFSERTNMETFADIIHGDKPVLVDFFATWCNPCKMMAPTIEAVGKEMAAQLRTLKVDIDKNGPLANQYRIQSVPRSEERRGGKECTYWCKSWCAP